MYTIKELVADKVTFLNEANLVDIEGINSVTTTIVAGKRKSVSVHIGLLPYFFDSTFKNIVRSKVKKDLGSEFDFRFAI